MTEEEIVIQINRGDLSVFQRLYTQYYVGLCVYAKRFTRSKDIAEEVVQDVFLRVWEYQGRLVINGSIKAYLFASVRNRCLDHLKHLQVVNRFNDHYTRLLMDAEDLYNFSQEAGDSVLIADELEKSVSGAIEALPEQCRKIFIMSRFDGLKHKDIANNLGVTVNTVQRQVSIALEKLRASLTRYLTLSVFLLKYLVD
jgi:RNA polymerase sigma-70 factor (family 1)